MKPVSVRELEDLFFGRLPGRHIMAVIRAAFDASMDHPCGITAVAGYIGDADEWVRVEEGWRLLLGVNKMESFHLKEVFGRFGRAEGLRVTEQFANLVRRSKLRSVHSLMLDSDWSALDKDSEYAKLYPERQHACLDMLFQILGEEVDLEFKGERIAVVLDQDYGPISRPAAIYEAWKERIGHPGFGVISFTKGELGWDTVPLQCADMLAGLLRQDPISRMTLTEWLAGYKTPQKLTPLTRIATKAKNNGRGNLWSLEIAKSVSKSISEWREKKARRQI